MTLYPGDRVQFYAQWSTWRGMRGVVVASPAPGLWVLIDGDSHPVAVSDAEVVRCEDGRHVAGAE